MYYNILLRIFWKSMIGHKLAFTSFPYQTTYEGLMFLNRFFALSDDICESSVPCECYKNSIVLSPSQISKQLTNSVMVLRFARPILAFNDQNAPLRYSQMYVSLPKFAKGLPCCLTFKDSIEIAEYAPRKHGRKTWSKLKQSKMGKREPL